MTYAPTRFLSCLLAVVYFSLSGCTTSNRNTSEANEAEISAPRSAAQIVHADYNERIATIRFGEDLGDSFLISKNTLGEQTAILKGIPSTSGSLKTADMLDGSPQINDSVERASPEKSDELAKIYRDAATENL